MLKKTLLRACLGFLIGMLVGNLIAILTGGISSDSFIPAAYKAVERHVHTRCLAVGEVDHIVQVHIRFAGENNIFFVPAAFLHFDIRGFAG